MILLRPPPLLLLFIFSSTSPPSFNLILVISADSSSPFLELRRHRLRFSVIGINALSCSQQQQQQHSHNTTHRKSFASYLSGATILLLDHLSLLSINSSLILPLLGLAETDNRSSFNIHTEKADEEQALRLPIPSIHHQKHMISLSPAEVVLL